MDETVSLLKKLLDDKLEAEQTWLVYRYVPEIRAVLPQTQWS
jgi:hypothetical protein